MAIMAHAMAHAGRARYPAVAASAASSAQALPALPAIRHAVAGGPVGVVLGVWRFDW